MSGGSRCGPTGDEPPILRWSRERTPNTRDSRDNTAMEGRESAALCHCYCVPARSSPARLLPAAIRTDSRPPALSPLARLPALPVLSLRSFAASFALTVPRWERAASACKQLLLIQLSPTRTTHRPLHPPPLSALQLGVTRACDGSRCSFCS